VRTRAPDREIESEPEAHAMEIIGIDTGGTFTDLVTVSGDSDLRIHKLPSTPAAPHLAILDGLAAIDAKGTRPVVHGTTVATNTVLERNGARVALVTTRGFRDVLELGRGDRAELYDLETPRPPALVARRLRLEADERVLADGSTRKRLTVREARRIKQAVRRSGAEAVAVCLLHAYASPAHERRLGEELASLDLPLSLSHALSAEFREYERMSTTVLNAYVQPRMGRYVQALTEALGRRSLRVMQSGGGTTDADRVAAEPVRTLLSGPVGGVVGALRMARASGFNDIISLDMGGTSTDVSLARGGPTYARDGRVAGYPVQTPMVDIHTIGAGGGSIAEVDPGGALIVGPRSAGADPGPVAYGKGGREPTVTDANVFLRRLPADTALAGGIRLDRTAVTDAMERLAAAAGGLSARKTAEGILRVVVSRMARAVRAITLTRGRDPRDFTLVAFGGAAGLHAADLAESLGITRVLLPAHAGVLSAYGLIAARAMQERSRTHLVRESAASPRALAPLFGPLVSEARAALRAEGIRAKDTVVERLIDCRYVGQSFDLTVPFGPNYMGRFHALHHETYGFHALDRPVEAVTLRVRALGCEPDPPLPSPRPNLPPGTVLAGPEVVPFRSSTTFIPRGWQARVDERGGLLLTPKGRD